MYQFSYDVMKKKYDDKFKLPHTDTDSFILHIETKDLYKDFGGMKEHMDFSGYDKPQPCYDNTNEKVLGKFKDEHDGKTFTQHIGLKPKVYRCETGDRKALKEIKGMDRKMLKHKSLIDDYLYTLTDNKKSHYTSNKICRKNHQVFSVTINEVGLSNYGNKRYYTNNITSLPYGDYSLN